LSGDNSVFGIFGISLIGGGFSSFEQMEIALSSREISRQNEQNGENEEMCALHILSVSFR